MPPAAATVAGRRPVTTEGHRWRATPRRPRGRTAEPAGRTGQARSPHHHDPRVRTAPRPRRSTAKPAAPTAARAPRREAPPPASAARERRRSQRRAAPARRRRGAHVRAIPLRIGRPREPPRLDRIVRGRAWIPLLGVLLVAIVGLRVEVLKLGSSVGREIQQATRAREQQPGAALAGLGAVGQPANRAARGRAGHGHAGPDGHPFRHRAGRDPRRRSDRQHPDSCGRTRSWRTRQRAPGGRRHRTGRQHDLDRRPSPQVRRRHSTTGATSDSTSTLTGAGATAGAGATSTGTVPTGGYGRDLDRDRPAGGHGRELSCDRRDHGYRRHRRDLGHQRRKHSRCSSEHEYAARSRHLCRRLHPGHCGHGDAQRAGDTGSATGGSGLAG